MQPIRLCSLLFALALFACAEPDTQLVAAQSSALSYSAAAGKALFEQPLPSTNGRACATCHVLEDDTTLKPEHVARLLREDPGNPLFDRLDADDPDAPLLTFEHLEKGLVRVGLQLADNVDVIDVEGRVITRPDRQIFVWRGVPTVANTAFTGPYQADGREPTLEQQARSAILSHSAGDEVAAKQLRRIAAFEQSTFSSPRAWFVSRMLELGVPEVDVPVPEDFMRLTEQEQRGRKVYDAACEACHGGATTDRIVDREAVDFLFPVLTEGGNVRYQVTQGQPPEPMHTSRPGVDFMNVGFGAASYFGQTGVDTSAFNASVELPRYRLRFYRDASRREALVDLPPTPVTVSGDPFDPRPALDAQGAPIVGGNLIPQQFTTDPGRAAITGDPADFEAFDVPQLRGIAKTAPYFHDNMRETLEQVVDDYSRFVLLFIKPLGFQPHPPEQEGGRREALSPEEKADLLAYLRRL